MATKKTISNSFVVNTVEDGKDGERGKVGRFFYFAGDFDANNTTQKFLVNDAQAPFFRNKNEGTEIYYYYVFNPEVNGEYTMSKMWEESVGSFNNKPWEIMTNDFKYLITEALFSNFAHLGSAIIKGDWMISQHGKIGDSNSTDFTKFNEENPNNNNGTDFIPNYAVNLRTGVSYQNEAYLTGSLFANSIQTNFVKIRPNMYEDTVDFTDFIVGADNENGGLSNSTCWNFIADLDATGTIHITLPTNLYVYGGQRVIIYNPNLGIGGGNGVMVEAKYVEWNNETKKWNVSDTEEGEYIRGVSIPYLSKPLEPVPLNQYTPVKTIEFVNGVVELMCVPSPYENWCEWCVVNIGTNMYKLIE